MADKARKWTDKQLSKIEKNISENYSQVEKELTEEWNKYAKKTDKEISKLEKKFMKQFEKDSKSGNTIKSDEIMKKWNKEKELYLMNSSEYEDIVGQITQKLANANQLALDYVNGQVPDIYAKNFAQVGFDIDDIKINYEGYKPQTIKKLVNENTVKNMIVEGDVKFHKKELNIFKDVKWNTKKMNSAVLQGIIKGESIQDMAKRISPIVQGNKASAIRNARTIVTGAENRGRLDSYEQLQEAGLVLKKVWLSTADGRTRDWHVDMDGQEVDLEEDFIDGLGNELEYPGDPAGAPETVYNCRCSMVTNIIGFKKENGKISYAKKINEKKDLHDIQMRNEKRRRKN